MILGGGMEKSWKKKDEKREQLEKAMRNSGPGGQTTLFSLMKKEATERLKSQDGKYYSS